MATTATMPTILFMVGPFGSGEEQGNGSRESGPAGDGSATRRAEAVIAPGDPGCQRGGVALRCESTARVRRRSGTGRRVRALHAAGSESLGALLGEEIAGGDEIEPAGARGRRRGLGPGFAGETRLVAGAEPSGKRADQIAIDLVSSHRLVGIPDERRGRAPVDV